MSMGCTHRVEDVALVATTLSRAIADYRRLQSVTNGEEK